MVKILLLEKSFCQKPGKKILNLFESRRRSLAKAEARASDLNTNTRAFQSIRTLLMLVNEVELLVQDNARLRTARITTAKI